MKEKDFVRKISSGQSRELINNIFNEVVGKKNIPEDISHSVILLCSQLNELEHKYTFGRMNAEEYNSTKTRINKGILELLPSLIEFDIIVNEEIPQSSEQETRNKSSDKIYDLYISLPMTSLTKAKYYEYDELRRLLLYVVNSVRECCGWKKIYCAALHIERIEDVLDPLISASVDLEPIEKSRNYMLIYPEKLYSSVLVESGISLALKMPSFYFVKDVEHLPYILREASAAFQYIYTKQFDDFNEIPNWIKDQGWKILTKE